ncbi:MAG: hypothetical protein ACTII7_09225, partial [Galactobacter sp.]
RSGQSSLNNCPRLAGNLILGGQPAVDNFDITSTAVHWGLFGQVYQQVKDLPPGSPIPEIKIEGP